MGAPLRGAERQPQNGEGELVGEPLVFGQLSLEVLAVSAPERTGKPLARTLVRPHSARPCGLHSHAQSTIDLGYCNLLKRHSLVYLLGIGCNAYDNYLAIKRHTIPITWLENIARHFPSGRNHTTKARTTMRNIRRDSLSPTRYFAWHL